MRQGAAVRRVWMECGQAAHVVYTHVQGPHWAEWGGGGGQRAVVSMCAPVPGPEKSGPPTKHPQALCCLSAGADGPQSLSSHTQSRGSDPQFIC